MARGLRYRLGRNRRLTVCSDEFDKLRAGAFDELRAGFACGPSVPTSASYFPTIRLAAAGPRPGGMDAAKLDAAIKFAVASENPATKDLAVDLATTFGREPFDTPIGPVKPRGALSGIIVKNGYSSPSGARPRAST